MFIRKPKSKQQMAGLRWRLITVTLLLNLLGYALVGWTLYESRLYQHERAESSAQNMAKLLEQSIADMIDKIELSLFVISDEIMRQPVGRDLNPKAMNVFLERLHAHTPEVGGMRIINAAGFVTNGSGKTLVSQADVRDREYFKYLRDHSDAATYISGPVVGRSSGDMVLIFSRRINHPDGSFGGVVNHTIELSHLLWLFSAVDIGAHGAISLRNENLGMIARFPELANHNRVTSERTRLPELQEFANSKQQYGSFIVKSSLDGIDRTISVRRIGKYPLYLIVGLAPEDYYANWWQAVVRALMALAVFSIVTVVMSVLLFQSGRDRMMLIEKLDRNQELFHAMADMSSDWFWAQDENFRFINISEEGTREHSMNPEGFIGKARWEVGIDKSEEEWREHKAILEAHQPFSDFEYSFINASDQQCCLSVSGEPVFDEDGQFSGYRGVGRDITERRRYEDRIAQMAQYDNLTGLPNRALFYDRLSLAISSARREQCEFALLYLDLDRFKPVNDRYGHDVGDQLLQMVASRIRFLLRESDTVARLGGDEFAVLLPVITVRSDAEEVAQRIISAITSPYTLDGIGEKVEVGVSIGIALYPRDGAEGDVLIKAADAVMYQSKQSGNRYSFCQ